MKKQINRVKEKKLPNYLKSKDSHTKEMICVSTYCSYAILVMGLTDLIKCKGEKIKGMFVTLFCKKVSGFQCKIYFLCVWCETIP